jgi:hypothetical protein
MDFLKKHYEKILLGFVLAGLIGVFVFMILYIASDREEMAQKREGLIHPRVTALTNLDLTVQSNAMARMKLPYQLDFETGNKLFNPLDWLKYPDGRIVPLKTGNEIGLNAVVVTNITPLYLILSLDEVVTNELGVRYTVGVEKQAALTAARRRKQSHLIAEDGEVKDLFKLVKVTGAKENPDALVLKLADDGEEVSIALGKPYRRVEAYIADFRYPPENNKTFHGRRIGDKVSFGGTDYLVVEVNQNELILADQSNQKKTSLPFTP